MMALTLTDNILLPTAPIMWVVMPMMTMMTMMTMMMMMMMMMMVMMRMAIADSESLYSFLEFELVFLGDLSCVHVCSCVMERGA